MQTLTPVRLVLLGVVLLLLAVGTAYADTAPGDPPESVAQDDPPQGDDTEAPDIPLLIGDALVSQRCTDCHTRTLVAGIDGKSQSRAEWIETVDRMIAYGAPLTDEERVLVIDYLARQAESQDSGNTPEQQAELRGEALVSVHCDSCHGPRLLAEFSEVGKERESWEATVDRMIAYGVEVSAENRVLIIDYLASTQPADFLAGDEDADAPPAAEDQPALRGDALVNLRCTDCHTRALVAGIPQDDRGRAAWADTVDRMIDYGAPVSPEERELIIAYLSGTAPQDRAGDDAAGLSADDQALLRGDALVNVRCTDCHTRTLVAGIPQDDRGRAAWEATVDRMIDYGARLTPAERALIINYLSSGN